MVFGLENLLITFSSEPFGGSALSSARFPSEYIQGSGEEDLFKPALDVDLSLVLPVVVQQLICGKGKSLSFYTTELGEWWSGAGELCFVFWWNMGFLQRLEFYGGDDSIEALTKF